MPEKLMRCYLATKKDLRADHEEWSNKRVDRVAKATCVKSTGQKFKRHDNTIDDMFNVVFGESGEVKGIEFQFSSDIKFIEKVDLEKFRPAVEINDPDSILNVGKAIWATDSANYNRYSEKELKKAVKTLPGKTCQVDHSESAYSTFGVVQDAWWDTGLPVPEIAYISELEGSNEVAQRVKKGYIRGVSVSGMADTIECSICGESWDWMHEHFPGQEYDGEVCYREMKDITFRHLGYTSFPAIEGADAQYIASSVHEALENAFAFIDYSYKHGVRKTTESKDSASTTPRLRVPPVEAEIFGEKISMSENTEYIETLKKLERESLEKAKLAEEKVVLENKLKEMETIQSDLKTLKEREKVRLVTDIVDYQEKLSLNQGKTAEVRRSELSELSEVALQAKVDVLKEMWDKEEKDSTPDAPPTITEQITGSPRSKNFKPSSKFAELDEIRKKEYIKEAKLEKLSLGLFGRRPSVSAVQTLREWDEDLERWNQPLVELIKQVPKGAANRS